MELLINVARNILILIALGGLVTLIKRLARSGDAGREAAKAMAAKEQVLREEAEYKRQQELLEIELAYREALTRYDKKAALDAGRKYYASLRPDGRLTLYDEQALANDIGAMKTT